MSEIKKILIAYDGSACSNAAVEDLKRAGLPDKVEALVVSVAEVFLPPAGEGKSLYAVVSVVQKGWAHAAEMVKAAEALAKQGAQKIKSHFPDWNVRSEASADSPAWGILKKAEEWKADLIVVGAHGLSSPGRLILGSISQTILTHASCSVRIVRESKSKTAAPNLVIGLDGSPFSDQVLAVDANRPWMKGTQVHVITVVDDRMMTSILVPKSVMQHWIQKEDAQEHAWVKRLTESATQKLNEKGLVVSSSVKVGDPKKVLLEEAERLKADCIFVGARGLSGIKHALIGSVSASIAARAHCPVEVIRKN